MAMPSLTTINEQLTATMNQLARLQRAVQAEIDAQAAPAMVSLPAEEVEELRAKAASKAAPAKTPPATT